MKNTPIQKEGLCLPRYLFLCLFFLVFFSISAHSQLNKFARNNFWFPTKPTAAIPEPNDTLDVSVCMGDTLVARPSLPEGMDITWNYEYTWKKFSAGNVNGTNLGSGNKKVDDMALTVDHIIATEPFYLKISIGLINEGVFVPYAFRVLRVHAITPPAGPTVNAVPALHFGESVSLQANSATSNYTNYVWYDKTYNQLATGSSFYVGSVEQDTTFYVTTQDVVSGYLYCISNPTKVDITIINPVFVPNAFTPNNDGLNDMFKVEGAYILSGARLSIYNSWGELVLQTNNVDRGWDGTVNGKPQPAGVYVYILDATLRSTGKLYKKHGPIALLR